MLLDMQDYSVCTVIKVVSPLCHADCEAICLENLKIDNIIAEM